MDIKEKLLLQNKLWAAEKQASEPEFFHHLSEIQEPKFLWIGCSDSRVPADKITGTEPGEIFVHRNIANLVINNDLNLLSVLKYAVEVLKVDHIIVCGHYGCGGIKAALGHHDYGFLNKWIRYIKDVYRYHKNEIELNHYSESQKVDKLVEFNVIEGVMNLAKTTVLQQAWHNGAETKIHGWVYALENGILHELISIDKNVDLDPIYKFDFEEE